MIRDLADIKGEQVLAHDFLLDEYAREFCCNLEMVMLRMTIEWCGRFDFLPKRLRCWE